MIAKNLISQIRKAKGPIFIETSNFNDMFWVQAVKSDLIKMIGESFETDSETGFILDKNGYFSKDFDAE
jgi:hypothetical protein